MTPEEKAKQLIDWFKDYVAVDKCAETAETYKIEPGNSEHTDIVDK